MPEVYNCYHRQARKDHKCCECGGVIKRGENYNSHQGIWEGEAETYKVCSDCDLLRDKCDVDVQYNEEKTPFKGLQESVFELGPIIIREFIQIKIKRGCEIKPWMSARIEK